MASPSVNGTNGHKLSERDAVQELLRERIDEVQLKLYGAQAALECVIEALDDRGDMPDDVLPQVQTLRVLQRLLSGIPEQLDWLHIGQDLRAEISDDTD